MLGEYLAEEYKKGFFTFEVPVKIPPKREFPILGWGMGEWAGWNESSMPKPQDLAPLQSEQDCFRSLTHVRVAAYSSLLEPYMFW